MEQKDESKTESFLQGFIKSSDAFVYDWSPKWRPVGKVVFLLLATILSNCIAPFAFIYKLTGLDKKKSIAIDKLMIEVKDLAYEGNEADAFKKLKSIKDELRGFSKKQTIIEPYGKFSTVIDYLHIIDYLYHLYTSYSDWESADTICDELLDDMGVYERKEAVGFERWIKRKAKCILHLKSKAKAEEFLLGYVKPDNDKYEINLFLYELRENEK